ncbi:EAL domain, c-di-GMP-specific phosphodiesterase class I (or its enzymatically inactive variant) [Devosia lucknowensis]|uniref:EAL domain, c-di-GMP-specific phosphodiesterase class I (Or its enzymatically inactive variant) n=1 Tax=Devosia lucknowensis TaxID=1096929 RepID=A0A1Y6EQ65_9HYPH|nr:EAL domain-containing protein [Devosia lucknowensis]SMQ64814.1 EAL domain, c-di-GMP-specific phosphodiesterase class I (or its enzymatically inactive variant) [Devosia lucknowensis]
MKSRFSHVLMLMGAILAFVPIVAVDYLLDAYVQYRQKAYAQQYVETISSRINSGAMDGVSTLRQVIAASPSLCTPTFVTNAQTAIEGSLNLRQVLVENLDGVQYCDAYGRVVSYSPLSQPLPIPGLTETMTVVKLGDLDMPALKVTQTFGETRRVSAFVPMLGQSETSLSENLPNGAMMRVTLTNGLSIMTIGDPSGFDRRVAGSDYVSAQGYAGQFPIKVEYAVPFAMVRADYADLDVVFTIIACVSSAVFLLLNLSYVRRSRVPAFDLERAIERNEIKPYYQPVINLRTGELVGCEVLCRWEKRNGQVIPPGAFIDYAEVTGLAIPMTVSLMQQVRNDLGDLSKTMPDMKISINLFEGHFRDVGIVEDVQAIFGQSPISFRQLVFEITERRPLNNSMTTTSVISGLHALGARLAMDDAGTGHSNLAYLATLGVDVIKIDRIFVDMIKPGTTQVPVLDGLIAMAKDLDCEIVAEGVETEEQALYLRSRGVLHAQGYIFAPALKIGAYRELALALHATTKNQPRLEVVASAA